MAILSSNISKDAADLYTGADVIDVGAGLMNPSIYKTPGYDKKKIQKLVLGGLISLYYSGFEVDHNPLVLTLKFEPAYNTFLGMNLHYIPVQYRQAILKYVLDSNAARIRSNQPIIADYTAITKNIPQAKYIVRRYKQVLTRIDETYPIVEWPNIISEAGQFSSHYRKFQQQGRK